MLKDANMSSLNSQNNWVFDFSLNARQLLELDAAIVQRISYIMFTQKKSANTKFILKSLHDIRRIYIQKENNNDQ